MQRATIIDVARRAGVSKSTVSRVLRDEGLVSEEARQRVLAAAQEMGYHPNALAGSLRTRRTHTIALVIPDITNPFFPEIARGAQKAADARGYSVLLGNTDWTERRERDFLSVASRYRVDGILINPARISARALKQVGCPVVVLGNREPYREFDIVGSDTRAALYLAVDHLLDVGRRRIMLIGGPADNPATEKRVAAYRAALAARAIPEPADAIVYTEFSTAGGYEAVQRILPRSASPIALICSNDLIALGALSALQDHGVQVPAEVAVIGIDNIDAAAVTCPSLTTIAKPKTRIGEEAADLLIDRIEGKEAGPPQLRLLPTELIVRASTVERERARRP